jgi:sugar porter (SP) family MFS transporter
MFGVEALPALAYFLLLFATPMSPRWLIARGRMDEARGVIEKLGAGLEESVDSFIARVRTSLEREHHSLNEPFFQRQYARPILLAVAIAAFNQLSGINAILYYAPAIFKSAGAGESAALLNSVGLGAVNLVFTMLALAVIDHFGRRKLMIVGSIGYIISLSATAWVFYTRGSVAESGGGSDGTAGLLVLISLFVFIASHAFGQGAVIWVFISEIFPNQLRARGQALGTFTHWVMAAVISQTFPIIAEASGGHVFAFYAVCMVGQLIWVLLVMPETKGVPLEDIQSNMRPDTQAE